MSEPSVSELLKRLQKLELQSDSINVERKIIVDVISHGKYRGKTGITVTGIFYQICPPSLF